MGEQECSEEEGECTVTKALLATQLHEEEQLVSRCAKQYLSFSYNNGLLKPTFVL